ncbi:MAG: hypothetical protein ACMVO3_16110 [Thalassobaculum sp.]
MKPIISIAALTCLILAACGKNEGADLIFGQQEIRRSDDFRVRAAAGRRAQSRL